MKTMRYRSLGWQIKLAQSLLFCVFIAALVFLYFTFYDIYTGNLIDINTSIVQQTAEMVASNNENLSVLMDSFSYSATIQQYLSETDALNKARLYTPVMNLLINYRNIVPNLRDIIIYSLDGGSIHNASISIRHIQDAITQTADTPYSRVFYNAPTNEYLFIYHHSVYALDKVREKLGDCYFVLNVSYMINHVQFISLDQRSQFYLVDENHNILMSNDTPSIATLLSEAYEPFIPADSSMRISRDWQCIAVAKNISGTNWTMLSITPLHILFQNLDSINNVTCVLVAVCLMLFLIYSRFFRRTAQSIKSFTHSLEGVEYDAVAEVPIMEDNLEFHDLTLAFRHMLGQLDSLKRKDLENQRIIYEKELESKEAQLLALQRQINPHFLYNTLECISSVSAMHGAWEVQEITVCLASIYKYAIKGDTMVTFTEELESVRAYLYIQSIRFPDRFTAVYDVPPSLGSLTFIKFILQPIVENCVKHGVESTTERCVIRIIADTDGKNLMISVYDSGPGIEKERLDAMNLALRENCDQSAGNVHIGLANINKRIKLYYSDEYGLSVTSSMGHGTCVTVTLPLNS